MARIHVHVQPGASRNEIVGIADDILRVKLTAPPVEGKANQALVAFLAKALQVRKSAVELLKGATSRDKIVSIEGLSDQEARERLRSITTKGS